MKKNLLLGFFLSLFLSVFSQKTVKIQDLSLKLWGLQDTLTGEIVLQPCHTDITNYNGQYYVVGACYLGACGLIDEVGNELLPCIYSGIYPYDKDMIIVKKNRKYGMLNSELKEIIPIEYDWLLSGREGYTVARRDNKVGVLNRYNDTVIPFQYKEIYINPYGYVRVRKDQKEGVLDTNNQIIIPIEFDYVVVSFLPADEKGFIKVIKNNKAGIYDTDGNLIVSVKYSNSRALNKELFAVQNNEGFYGIIDRNEKLIIPYEYSSVGKYQEGIAIAQNSQRKWGAIDMNNDVVVPFIYSDFFEFKEGRAVVCIIDSNRYQYGYINKHGKQIVELGYDMAYPFEKGYARVRKNKKMGYIDTAGKEVLPLMYDFVSKPKEGMMVVVVIDGKKYMLYDLNSHLMSNESFEYISSSFEDRGLILARKNNLYGYLDFEGNTVIPFVYEYAMDFEGNYANVMLDGVSFLIDKKGVKTTKN